MKYRQGPNQTRQEDENDGVSSTWAALKLVVLLKRNKRGSWRNNKTESAKMLVLGQAPSGALSARRCSLSSPPKFTNPNPPLFSNRKPRFASKANALKSLNITLAKADGGIDSTSAATKQAFSSSPPPPPPPSLDNDQPVFVGQENIPLEGVIQFEKPSSSSRLRKWG